MSDVAHYSHPVAIAHAETGRQALFVNRLMTARIDGLDEAESDAVIDALLRVSEDPAIVYGHVWQPGDVGQSLRDPRPHALCRHRAQTAAADHHRRLPTL